VFAGEFLMAVMVLFCGDDEKHVGAIELWHNDADVSHEMGLVDGYYGTADMFEFNSRHTKFPRGFGLPGRTWKASQALDHQGSAQFKTLSCAGKRPARSASIAASAFPIRRRRKKPGS